MGVFRPSLRIESTDSMTTLTILSNALYAAIIIIIYGLIIHVHVRVHACCELVRDMVLGTPDAPCSGLMREMQVWILKKERRELQCQVHVPSQPKLSMHGRRHNF
jgi:hypothetical protein